MCSCVCVKTEEVEKGKGIGESYITNCCWWSIVVSIRWRRLVDIRRCFFANLGSEIKKFKNLQRHRSCTSNFTGSLHRISGKRSKGRVGSSSGGHVRVPATNRCLWVLVVSTSFRLLFPCDISCESRENLNPNRCYQFIYLFKSNLQLFQWQVYLPIYPYLLLQFFVGDVFDVLSFRGITNSYSIRPLS